MRRLKLVSTSPSSLETISTHVHERKVLENRVQLLLKRVLREFDLAHAASPRVSTHYRRRTSPRSPGRRANALEAANARDLHSRVDLGRRLSLRLAEDNLESEERGCQLEVRSWPCTWPAHASRARATGPDSTGSKELTSRKSVAVGTGAGVVSLKVAMLFCVRAGGWSLESESFPLTPHPHTWAGVAGGSAVRFLALYVFV